MTTLIIGLGNIGRNYVDTRHNLGFLAVEYFAETLGATFSNKQRLKADIAETSTSKGKLVLAKPTTLMNLSGQAAVALKRWTKAEKIIVVYDDADLPLGKIQVRTGGSSAGHNGIKSIVSTLGQDDFLRIRVGIGRSDNEHIPLDEWVLSKWSPEEKDQLPEIIENVYTEIEKNL